MASFTIPTIYTAEDRFSGTLRKMKRSNDSFANSLGGMSAMSDRAFRKMTPAISEAGKQMLSYASAAAVASAAFGLGKLSIDSIMEYENALASFHTIVGHEKPFSIYEKAINSVASNTKKSSIEVAQSFEKIAGLNAKFAETAEGISSVSEAAITLSKASRDDLGSSAESLVGIMNQFSFSASEANRTINVLAAGQAVGAASIKQTAETFTTFGSTAAGANITLEQSVGLIETLGKFSIFGSEAGTQLKGSIMRLQQAGVGYASGQFRINDALEESKKRYDTLKTAKEKDAYLDKTFGAINIGVGRTLLNNIDLYKSFTAQVTNTSDAQKAAQINSNTLSNKLSELKNAWINMLTGSSSAGSGLEKVKDIIGFVTRNLDNIVTATISVIKIFAIWKLANLAMRAVLFANNVIMGVNIALQRTSVFALRGNAVATTAYSIASRVATAATWLWNAALAANPIGLVIVAIAALAGGLMYLSNKHSELLAQYEKESRLNASSAYNEETKSINGLTQSYIALGKGKKEAFALSLAFSKQENTMARIDVEKRIADNKQKIANTPIVNRAFSSEYKKAQEDLVKNSAVAKELAHKSASIAQSASSGSNLGLIEKKDAFNILNQKKSESGYSGIMSPKEIKDKPRINALYELQKEGMAKEVLNPKEAQANANVKAMNAKDGKLEVNFNNAPVGTTVTSTNKAVVPKVTSTY